MPDLAAEIAGYLHFDIEYKPSSGNLYVEPPSRHTPPHYAIVGGRTHAAFCKTSKTLNNAMISHSKAVFRRMFPAEMMLLGKEPTTPIIVAMDPAKHVRELQGTLDDLATPASAFEKRTMSEMQKLDNDDSVNAVYFWLCQRLRSMLAFYNTRGFTVDRSLATTSFNLEEMNLVVTIEREWCLPHRVGFSAYRAFQQQGISKTKEVLFSAARPLGDVRTSGRRLTRRSSATEGFFELANVLTPKEVLKQHTDRLFQDGYLDDEEMRYEFFEMCLAPLIGCELKVFLTNGGNSCACLAAGPRSGSKLHAFTSLYANEDWTEAPAYVPGEDFSIHLDTTEVANRPYSALAQEVGLTTPPALYRGTLPYDQHLKREVLCRPTLLRGLKPGHELWNEETMRGPFEREEWDPPPQQPHQPWEYDSEEEAQQPEAVFFAADANGNPVDAFNGDPILPDAELQEMPPAAAPEVGEGGEGGGGVIVPEAGGVPQFGQAEGNALQQAENGMVVVQLAPFPNAAAQNNAAAAAENAAAEGGGGGTPEDKRALCLLHIDSVALMFSRRDEELSDEEEDTPTDAQVLEALANLRWCA